LVPLAKRKVGQRVKVLYQNGGTEEIMKILGIVDLWSGYQMLFGTL
jgi:hypothetical protein